MAFTGDNARVTQVSAGALRAPDQVPMPARLEGLPRAPADPFVGRGDALSALEQALDRQGASVVTQAVYGLGGVGKSELALQYAAGHTHRYPLIWWTPAETEDVLQESLAALARRLEPALTFLDATTVDAAEWVVQWLQCHSGWLLVLDNVEDRATVAGLLGRVGRHGHIVITTRLDINWRGSAKPLPLDVLTAEAAVELLAQLVGSAGEPEILAELAAELGFLPLALEQAGAYIAEQRISPERYLQLLREKPGEAFAAVDQGGQASRTIARVWDITLAVIHEREEPAAQLLEVLAYFAPDAIPRRYLTSAVDDPAAVDRALGVLASYSLVTLDADTVSLHRLVQAVVREKVKHAYRHAEIDDTPAADAARILDSARPPGNPQTAVEEWPQWRELVPHIDALTQAITDEEATERIASLLAASAFFAWTQGQHHTALPREQRALEISEVVHGSDHLTVAARLNNLASTLNALGRAGEALPLRQRALQISEAALGPDHPTVATVIDNLAFTLHDLGRDGDALALRRRALRISEAALGPDHPTVAIRLDNLAVTLNALGRPGEALPLRQRALRISEAALGPDHPTVATGLDNLAVTLNDLGRPGEAMPLHQRALKISEAALGLQHPDVAHRLNNLAVTLNHLGRADEALALLQRALQISEAALGAEHPDVAIRLNNLAYALNDLGRADEALPLLQRALQISEAALGPEHPTVATRLGNLAVSHFAVGKRGDAVALCRRAVQVANKALPSGHPTVASLQAFLEMLHREIGPENRSG